MRAAAKVGPKTYEKREVTLTLQKSKIPQIQGAKGDAIVSYCEPLGTQEMLYHRLSRGVNNTANIIASLHLTIGVVAWKGLVAIQLAVLIAVWHTPAVLFMQHHGLA